MKIGEPAAAFTLYNTDKKSISLDDFKGQNLVMLFFPFAFTSTCTTELCMVRDDISSYAGLDAATVAISVDSLYTLKRYKEDQNLNFELLSDFNKEVSAVYDTLYETFGLGMKGVSKRSVFVIDKEGILRHSEILENASEIPDLEKVKQILSTI